MEKPTTRPIYYFMLIATLVLAGVHYWDVHHTGHDDSATVNVQHTPQESAQVGLINNAYFQIKKITQNNQYTTIDIEYPEFVNIDSKENRKIYDFYMEFIKDHNMSSQANMKARFDTDPENTGKSFTSQVITEDDKYQAYGGFTLFQENDDFISVLFSYGAFQGGAHGFEDLKSFNYDVKNKKIVSLADILKVKNVPETDVYTFVSAESRKQLLAKFAPDVAYKSTFDELVYNQDQHEFILQSIYDGTEPVPENFSIYTFTPDALTIYFGQYQVASYADGEQQVVIPLK